MTLGEYIKDRWIVGMLREIAEARGGTFRSWSDDWVMELADDGSIHHIVGYRFDLNDSVSAAIAQDKVATYQLLAANDIPAVEHTLLRTKVSAFDKTTLSKWDGIVIKPLDGTSGHGVKLVDDIDEATRIIESSTIQAWAASPFIDIAREIRIIMLDGEPLLSYEKRPVTQNGLKMFNLGLGASPDTIMPSHELVALAARAQSALGLRLSSVDLIETTDGEIWVLELNDAIMMEHFARVSTENRAVAKRVYDSIIEKVFAD